MMPDTPQGDLAHILPLEIVRNIDGCIVKVSPLVTAELPPFLAQLVPLMATMPGFGPGFFKRLASEELTDAEILSVLTTFAANGAELIELVITCTRSHVKPSDVDGGMTITGEAHATWVRGLLIDRTIDLAVAALMVNADFFKRAVSALRAMASRFKPAAAAGAASPAAASATPKPSSS